VECRKHDGRTFDNIGDNMDKTKIVSVGKASNSVRTVIPMWVAKMLDIEVGDKVTWEIIKTSKGYAARIEVDE